MPNFEEIRVHIHRLALASRMDGGGFEPPKQVAADLQSVPFGHSGIHPKAKTLDLHYTIQRSVLQEENLNNEKIKYSNILLLIYVCKVLFQYIIGR